MGMWELADRDLTTVRAFNSIYSKNASDVYLMASPLNLNFNDQTSARTVLHRVHFKNIVIAAFASAILSSTCPCPAQTPATRPELIYQPRGNFENNIDRPLRYWPIDTDFVITNGVEFFNRPLYCLNSGFRIDGGDKPEFSLYLPGRGGNLRLGIKTSSGIEWLNDAKTIIARYRPGSLLYEITDPLLGDGQLNLAVLPLASNKGVIVQAQLNGANADLILAYGGANGVRGSRDGDIGCEREPVAQFFQLQPEQCRGNSFAIASNTFTLHSPKAIVTGVLPDDAMLSLADAHNWNSPEKLFTSSETKTDLPIVTAEMPLRSGQPVYLALEQLSSDGQAELPVYRDVSNQSTDSAANDHPASIFKSSDLPKAFAEAERHRAAIAQRVSVETPDAFINAAAAALCIAADAVWDDKQQCFMHGAVAWRTRLLGWRGQYAGDALGWHERTAAHFASFAKQQIITPIPDKIPPPDEQFNLARSEAALHSNGDMMKNHYDMNLVAVDAFFRHLLWTDDLNYARQMWPVIERHLAWERRLFRREFGPDKLPLYEAYAAIWASDDLNYNGAGTAHASAYNYFANTMAARVAVLIGKDPAPYQHEADLILRGMNKYLWLAEEGNFAESKDLLGLQLAHPNSGLWTFYHTLDSDVPTPQQAWQMSRWIDNHIAHIPIRGKNVPTENLFTLPETSWMPYQWSLNNVVMAEAAHTSLGFWQANRPETAFQLFKGELLDSMFLGLCPGNVGAMTSHDMARGEAQRDFADAIGVNSRALVEGLFGVKPDALAGNLKVVPGFPDNWNFATVHHPDFDFEFHREGSTDTYVITPKFSKPMALDLQIQAPRTDSKITINGQSATAHQLDSLFGAPRIALASPAADKFQIVVNWSGEKTALKPGPEVAPTAPEKIETYDWRQKITYHKLETVDLTPFFNDKVTQIFRNAYRSPRSPFASLATPKQGIGGWCEPNASFDVNDSGLRALAARDDDKIVLPDGVPLATPGESSAKNIIFTSQWDNYPREVSVPLSGKSVRAFLLMAGSTDAMKSRFDNGEILVTYTDGSTQRLALNNPVNWWPIDQDYFIDDYAFRRDEPLPPRVDLRTGNIRILDLASFKGKGGKVPGGAATVLTLPLNPEKELKSVTVRALANEVVIGLMSVTLER
jgi:hypothetical protein